MISKEAIRDDELIRAHLNGSKEAFERLVAFHAPNLTSVLERMVHDHHTALDLAQEVFIKVHRVLPRYRFNGRFRSMLYAIAMNHGRDALRKKKRAPIVFLDESRVRRSCDRDSDPGSRQDLKAAIEEAMNRVPSPFKEAVYLRDVVGLSYGEAAETLGCSLGTVKSRINRGRLAFRDIYTELAAGGKGRGKGGHYAS